MNFLNLTDTSVPLETVKDKLKSYCATPWNQVRAYLHTKHTYSSAFLSYLCPSQCLYCTLMISLHLLEQIRQRHPTTKLKYLAEYCFSGTYILTLLTEGYNFTSETYSNIEFIQKVSRSQSTPFPSHTPQSINAQCVCVQVRPCTSIFVRTDLSFSC